MATKVPRGLCTPWPCAPARRAAVRPPGLLQDHSGARRCQLLSRDVPIAQLRAALLSLRRWRREENSRGGLASRTSVISYPAPRPRVLFSNAEERAILSWSVIAVWPEFDYFFSYSPLPQPVPIYLFSGTMFLVLSFCRFFSSIHRVLFSFTSTPFSFPFLPMSFLPHSFSRPLSLPFHFFWYHSYHPVLFSFTSI